MYSVAGLATGAVVLWLWLSAHWFGRVLAFLAFSAALGFVAIALNTGDQDRNMISVPIAVAVSWIIASLPVYRQRRMMRRYGIIPPLTLMGR